MSAGPAATRSPQHPLDAAVPRAGHTRITARTLVKVVEAVTAEAFGIPAASVGVGLHDVKGRLGVTPKVAVIVPSLQAAPRIPDAEADTVYARASRARAEIIRRVGLVTGAEVGRVDIRVTGIHTGREPRVR